MTKTTVLNCEEAYKKFLERTGFAEKQFQIDCFKWCFAKEKALAASAAGASAAGASAAGASAAGARVAGGILALEMGLGKTLMMLALLELNFKRHTLIVLPCALLDQWEKSIIKTFGHHPLVYHGSRPKCKKMNIVEIMGYPIILTTYGQISLPSAKLERRGRRRSILYDIPWDRLICDEAHNVSHHKTNEYKGVCELKSKLIWLVTGTPIQNRTKELETLFSIFGIGSISPSDMDETIKKLIFHRTKAAAGIQLPPLAEHKKAVLWANAVEQKLAVNIHKRLSFCNVIPTGAAAEDDDDPDADVDMSARGMRMRFMAKAKKICIYPPLLEKNYGYVDHDSKISIVVQTLGERINNGCGKIVFCNYYDEIDEFARRFLALGVSVAKFDGRVPRGKRDSLLSTQVTVLLAQIKMCREGLNLQDHYSEVYFPSPNFNPAIENQAIARCWRMGQKNPVHVFRFLMEEPTLIPTPIPTAVLDMDTDMDTDPDTDSESSEADTDTEDTEEEDIDADTDAEKKPAYSMDTYSYNLQTKKRELIALMEEMAAK